MILTDYDHHSKEEKSSFEVMIVRLKEEVAALRGKEKEMVDYYEKDKIDTEQKLNMVVDIYDKEIEALKGAIGQKNNELQHTIHEF